MDEYAGRVLADRYRLPLPPADEYEFVETRAFDTYSGQEVHLRQIPLPEVVDAEVMDEDARVGGGRPGRSGWTDAAGGVTDLGGGDPAVRRAIVAATAAAQLPDHPRLGQVFHVFAESGSLWIVSELVAGRPLAALLAEGTLSPHRAAEVANDILTALRALHAHGWVHRNITARTVLLCDDGRAMLTGLAAGAAEEALCGYDPVPGPSGWGTGADAGLGPDDAEGTAAASPGRDNGDPAAAEGRAAEALPRGGPGAGAGPGSARQTGPQYRDQGAAGGFPATGPRNGGRGPAYRDQGAAGGFPGPRSAPETEGGVRSASEGRTSGFPAPRVPGGQPGAGGAGHGVTGAEEGEPAGGGADPRAAAARAARASAIAAYAAGARAAARASIDTSAPHRGRPEAHPGPDRGPDPGPDLHAGGARWPAASPEFAEAGSASGTWDTGDAPASGAATGSGTANGLGTGRRGPATALAAERARQARIVMVGAVTERWAPEQAGPVHENWQLAPPVGPAADLWALGALLFRAVQGHAPYPEESAAELVQLVCAEAPAYAEECGPLRPVVESLMRQDPTERPDFEELRGWLRSLIRSAPEPDVGSRTVVVPSLGAGGASDPRRLPIVRRRGWLVRRGRGRRPVPPAPGRHKRAKQPRGEPGRQERTRPQTERQAPRRTAWAERPDRPERQARASSAEREPRRLGRVLVLLILLALAAAVLYAMMFMPRAKDTDSQGRTGSAGAQSAAPGSSQDPVPTSSSDGDEGGAGAGDGGRGGGGSAGPGSQEPQSTSPPGLAKGFAVRTDPKGFKVAVDEDWIRRGENARGQIRYIGGDFELVVVAGRDKASEFGADPMAYQQDREAELAAFRGSSWASSSGLRRIDVGKTAMAEGEFSWRDSSGRDVYARNLAMLIDSRYHVVLVIGPSDERRAVSRYFEQATATYSTTS